MLWEKWKINKQQILILLCVGILLLVIAVPTKETAQHTFQSNDLETRLEKILSRIEGIGEVHVMITMDEEDMVQGIAVSAQRGDRATIAKEIVEVVRALFDIEMHKIKVIKGGS